LRIAIDIDSTLHHYWDVLSASSKRRFGVELPYEEQLTWGITRLKPKQLEVCIADTHRDEAILAAEPYEGAVEVVRRWHAAGHFIQITSHRAEACHEATARWLERIELPHDELWCSYDKIERCRELGIEVLIDDSPINLQRALDHGITAATILHPWNAEVCETEEVIAADDWPALERALALILSR
jgi:uncharacterized HAD superfamily protein